MKNTENGAFANAMAFYHEDGLPAAWGQATRFAGKQGRLAIMPDIVASRINSRPGEKPWETYYTTLTAEYFGVGKDGNRILIVAHGVGPMSTLDGIREVYSWEYKDKSRRNRGGRITQEQFWDLESGKFGEVEIIDFDAYLKRYKYPFMQILRVSEALTDPVLKARFGPETENYINAHAEHARNWHRDQADLSLEEWDELLNLESWDDQYWDNWYGEKRALHAKNGLPGSDPFIIQVGDASNCSYQYKKLAEGQAMSHLVSTGRLCHLCHEGNESLTLDVGCHEWWNSVRLVAIKPGGNIRTGIQTGPDAYRLLRDHWRELLIEVENPEQLGFRALVQIEDQWFTQYPKQGARMDTWEPECVVTSMRKVGEPVLFKTTVGGYHGFFRFGLSEVESLAPPGANAYNFVSDPEIEWVDGNPEYHTTMAQFYRIEADSSRRLIRADQLRHDYDKMMKLLREEVVA